MRLRRPKVGDTVNRSSKVGERFAVCMMDGSSQRYRFDVSTGVVHEKRGPIDQRVRHARRQRTGRHRARNGRGRA